MTKHEEFQLKHDASAICMTRAMGQFHVTRCLDHGLTTCAIVSRV